MNKIGNIIFNEDLVKHDKVDYINYYQDNFDEVNYDLPTLFVGWKFFKENYIKRFSNEDVSILDKKIVFNLLYWEFSFKENKQQHILGVDEFTRKCPNYFYNPKYNYTNLDPVMFNISGETELFHILPKSFDIYYNYKNEMIYLFSGDKIIGIDAIMYSYFDFNINTIKEKLESNSNNVFNDISGEEYQKFYKIYPNFDNLKRYVGLMLNNS